MPAMRRPRCFIAALIIAATALPAQALDLRWPEGARLAAAGAPALAGFTIATGPFENGRVPMRSVEGVLSEQIWQVDGAASDPLLLLRLLREQLEDGGFEIGFTCAARACGGFDFRHGVPIAVSGDMFVDLTDFHYLAASRDAPDGETHLALTVSRGGTTGFAHLAVVTPPGDLPPGLLPAPEEVLEVEVVPATSLSDRLETEGRAVLEDLSFDIGAASLSGARYDSLTALAVFLAANPATGVVLVGHTDAQGGLDTNIRLSRARAQAVRRYLIEELDVAPAQVEAEGIGYLAPRESNATPEGREANRRVEVVIATLPE